MKLLKRIIKHSLVRQILKGYVFINSFVFFSVFLYTLQDQLLA